MGECGGVWQCMAGDRAIWRSKAEYCGVLLIMVAYGGVWGIMAAVGGVWRSLKKYG